MTLVFPSVHLIMQYLYTKLVISFFKTTFSYQLMLSKTWLTSWILATTNQEFFKMFYVFVLKFNLIIKPSNLLLLQ